MIYMPMIPEAAAAMLACARIGAVHSVVFGGFSPESLAGRIADCDACAVITADEGVRGGKPIPLKRNVDTALEERDVPTVIVVTRTGADVPMKEGRDVSFSALRDQLATDCEPEVMNAEDPLFILYTSGSTGKPKGVVHTTGGYAVWAATTFDWVFDYRPEDIFWCTADIGWITGHSYVVYGPLAMGATSVMFDGVPNYPDFGRFWETVDRLGVTIFYTAPTAIRALMREGDEPVKRHSRKSLRLLGTVGEPINPEAWEWYWRVVGDERCPIVDTWWQTETGGILISPVPGATPMKPGSATRPLPGHRAGAGRREPQCPRRAGERKPVHFRLLAGADAHRLGRPRPLLRDLFQDLSAASISPATAAAATRTVIIGSPGGSTTSSTSPATASAPPRSKARSCRHPKVAEAAVVGYPHEIKGQAIYAFVTLNAGEEGTDALRKELNQEVRHDIGALAAPDKIQFTPALPKTRSGKIMRRILRKIAEGETDGFGDTSTLADPGVVDALLAGRQ